MKYLLFMTFATPGDPQKTVWEKFDNLTAAQTRVRALKAEADSYRTQLPPDNYPMLMDHVIFRVEEIVQ